MDPAYQYHCIHDPNFHEPESTVKYIVERYHKGQDAPGWVIIGTAAETREQAIAEADAALAADPKRPVQVREVESRVIYQRCSEPKPEPA